MADFYPPITGTDAKQYLIYLVSTGDGLRTFLGRDVEIPNQINRTVTDANGNVIGYGAPIFDNNFFTQVYTTTYPGQNGEAYVTIDPINQRSFLQENPTNLYVDSNGTIQRKTAFGEFSKLTVTANNIDSTSITGLPGNTKVEIGGLAEAKVQIVFVNDGTFTLMSPIAGSTRVRLSHNGYIQKEYTIGFV